MLLLSSMKYSKPSFKMDLSNMDLSLFMKINANSYL